MTDRVILGGNWYIQEINQAHRIAECGLPDLRMNTEQFVMSGGYFTFDSPTEVSALGFEIALQGAHEAVRGRFGREPGDWTTFTYYERTKDLDTNKNFSRVVSITGLVNGIANPRIVGRRPGVTRYAGGSVWKYIDIQDGKVIHRFDFRRNILVADGVEISATGNDILRIN
ncbi:phage major tail tube protein [Aureimonas sp. ME7]|uniref:phage major tail tube protein n=1 Tax=Aureimonas sp. ME7 TaxID=2744252 RepID=UPI0015F6B5F6|nr:phage major tail tube protein [Aureimonas sp. ME7]